MRKEGSRSALFLFLPTLLSTRESTGTLPDLPLPSSFLSSWVLRSFPVRAVDRKRTGSISRSFLNYELLIVPASQEVYDKYTLCLSRSALKTGQASHSSVTKKTHSVSPVSRVNFPARPFYPGLNIVSDHPFAILQGNGITGEAQMAPKVFRDFLLAEQQRQALISGFRPTNPSVHITDKVAGNPFLRQPSAIQIESQIQPLAQAPSGDVINELIKQWSNRYQDASTSPS